MELVKGSALPGCPESLVLLADHCLQHEEEERILAREAKEWLLELEGDIKNKTAERVPSSRGFSGGSGGGKREKPRKSDESNNSVTGSRFKRMTIRLRGKTKEKPKKRIESSAGGVNVGML